MLGQAFFIHPNGICTALLPVHSLAILIKHPPCLPHTHCTFHGKQKEQGTECFTGNTVYLVFTFIQNHTPYRLHILASATVLKNLPRGLP
jgi:hypothetical protein